MVYQIPLMKPKKQVRDLGRRFNIETPHVEQVATLALALFDGFGFDPSERHLLAAAARLHDIGYASDPDHHVDAGLQILKDHPLDCFSSDEWTLIGLIVSLHRRTWRPVLTEAVLEEMGRPRVETAKRLAAVLRIADGLDHSHIQDASILACRRGKKVDAIRVRSRWYANNIPWAEGKSDLWEAVFARSFRIKEEKKKRSSPFDGVVRRSDSALCAARRILVSQYDVMRDCVPGILEQMDPDCLHDYRVALRRFRAALRLFRPLLAQTSAPELEPRLSALCDRLGPLRDAHVLLDFFQTLDAASVDSPDVFLALEKNAIGAHRAAAEIVESEECLAAVRLMSRLLRVDLPALERSDEDGVPFKAYVRRRFKRQVKRIRAEDVPEQAAGLHELRKRCRRARYVAEFVAPVCGPNTARLAKRLKAVATSLGEWRDLTLHAAALENAGVRELDELFARRAAAQADFARDWKKLIDA